MTKQDAEEFCRSETDKTGRLHDWHYIGGKVHVKAMRDTIKEIELKKINKELLAALEKVVSDITALSESSYGVHGLHRNGDLAPWSSLFSGGFFEDWLLSVDEAGALIAKAKGTS